MDLALMPATDLLALYAAKKLSPVEVTGAALSRIEALNDRLNAFCLVDRDGAIAAARESEQRWHRGEPRGIVDGVPTTVKDLLLTRGWPTLRGSRVIARDQPWNEDAPAVARLREQGAILLGKTTTPEFGWKGVTDSPLTGITRNPWNMSKTPGGSSGGAAVAAATGMGALHLGTDGGGSIRIPASFSGIFGYKQSFGRVPAYPSSPFGTLAHVGPMTRSVADAALMLTVISRPDPRDWHALPAEARDYRAALGAGIKGLRAAYAPTIAGVPVDREVADLVARAVRVFEDLGAAVEEARPDLEGAHEVFQRHWFAGAALLLQGFSQEQRRLMDPGLVRIAEEGSRLSLIEYLEAMRRREAMGQAMNAFHQKYDLLLMPTMPLAAFDAGRDTPQSPASEWSDWSPFTYPFNLTRQPAASVPCGLTSGGLPVGLQIIGPLYGDELVLRAARAFEEARPWPLPSI